MQVAIYGRFYCRLREISMEIASRGICLVSSVISGLISNWVGWFGIPLRYKLRVYKTKCDSAKCQALFQTIRQNTSRKSYRSSKCHAFCWVVHRQNDVENNM